VSKNGRAPSATTLPLSLRWHHPARPLPLRTVRLPRRARPRTIGLEAPPWLVTGPADRPFHGGELIRRRRGVAYQVQRYFVDDREMLYLVTFCLPRFLDQDFDDKFITLFHELYHISPAFEGDLRRHEGRYEMHSHSKRHYDAHMADLARSYMHNGADRPLHGFLRLNFAQLQHRHGSVVAVQVPRPRLLPVAVEVN